MLILSPVAALSLPDILSAILAAVAAAIRSASPLEVAGVLTGVACVWLAARNSIWNFPIGILNGVLYMAVFWQSRLYSDAGLQLAFIALLLYGWARWLRGNAAAEAAPLPITRTPPRLAAGLLGAGLLYALVAGFLFSTRTDAALPYWDSTTTAISLAAQLLLSRRHLENWLLWVGVDVAYVGMYWHRDLFLTSGLYVIFLGLAAYGYWQWRREMRAAAGTVTASQGGA
ncbi:nicotinamide riboside transporter PnuC [Hymenobacter properus]|uniref:Nicotinamide riboside transporter PnuC n=1 Tax=Hymenobacter properus TaxID=2791026 RepID=A0A931BKY1_9BACT|nr:nicotinamide riboside transporter PnuC [Hymenobacter properus]MBF9141370.1 nicotinamide mononucleotide transporter [Hymenobacter properus]MBR7720179.1 nicotinamide mononucleotide transporter [Microvirga sp. SRT04]